MKVRTAAVGAVLALVAFAALIISSAGSAKAEQDDFTMAIVTDIGKLQDRSFNQLANEGRLEVGKELGIQTRVYLTKTEAERIPNMLAAARAGLQPHLRRRLPQLHRGERGCAAVPEPAVRRGRPAVRALREEAEERDRHRLRRARGRLSRRLPRRAAAQEPGWPADHQRGRREQRAGDREVHQRLHPGRQEGEPEDQGARELRERPDLLRPGEVQGDRARPDPGAARGRSSRSPAAAASARSRRRRRRRSGASASTPTSSTSVGTC